MPAKTRGNETCEDCVDSTLFTGIRKLQVLMVLDSMKGFKNNRPYGFVVQYI